MFTKPSESSGTISVVLSFHDLVVNLIPKQDSNSCPSDTDLWDSTSMKLTKKILFILYKLHFKGFSSNRKQVYFHMAYGFLFQVDQKSQIKLKISSNNASTSMKNDFSSVRCWKRFRVEVSLLVSLCTTSSADNLWGWGSWKTRFEEASN